MLVIISLFLVWLHKGISLLVLRFLPAYQQNLYVTCDVMRLLILTVVRVCHLKYAIVDCPQHDRSYCKIHVLLMHLLFLSVLACLDNTTNLPVISQIFITLRRHSTDAVDIVACLLMQPWLSA